MRDLGERMAELKFEAPLAKFEDADEWGGCEFISAPVTGDCVSDNSNLCVLNDNINSKQSKDLKNPLEEALHEVNSSTGGSGATTNDEELASPNGNTIKKPPTNQVETFLEAFGGSLEDLVNTFDEKITKCFGNYEQDMEDLAPVVVRSQEEIMSECQ